MKLTINLASRICINRRMLYLGYAVVTALLLGALAWQIVSVLAFHRLGSRIRAELTVIEAAVGKRPPPMEVSPVRRQKVQEEVAFANELIGKDSFRWTSLLGRLEGVAVEGVSLRSVQPDFKGKTLRLTGVARNVPQLQAYLDRLIGSPDFTQVYLLDQGTVAERDGSGGTPQVNFSLTTKGGF